MPKKVRLFTDQEVLKIARYYLATRNSYDATAKVFNTIPMTIRTCIQVYLPRIDQNLYEKCMKLLEARKRENIRPVYPHNERQKAESMKKIDDCIYQILKESNEEWVKITEKMIQSRIEIGRNALCRYRKLLAKNSFCRYTIEERPMGSAVVYYYKLKPE